VPPHGAERGAVRFSRAAVVGLALATFLSGPAACGAEVPGAADPAAGTIAGRVILRGPAPPVRSVPVGKDRWLCGTERVPAALRLGPAGAVAEALVVLEGRFPQRAAPGRIVLDNRDCEFAPRVLVAPVGSDLEVVSSDPVLHTAHAYLEGRECSFPGGRCGWTGPAS